MEDQRIAIGGTGLPDVERASVREHEARALALQDGTVGGDVSHGANDAVSGSMAVRDCPETHETRRAYNAAGNRNAQRNLGLYAIPTTTDASTCHGARCKHRARPLVDRCPSGQREE